jgi:hypothetical protein
MRVYFTDSHVPELADLNRSQRKIVRRGALEMLRKDQPSILDSARLINGAAVAVAAIVGIIVGHSIHTEPQWLLRAIVVGLVAHVALVLSQSFVTERLRPYFRMFVEQHRDEIVSAA